MVGQIVQINAEKIGVVELPLRITSNGIVKVIRLTDRLKPLFVNDSLVIEEHKYHKLKVTGNIKEHYNRYVQKR